MSVETPAKEPYETPVLVRVGSFEEVTQQLSMMDLLSGAMIVDWSGGRVS